MRNLIKEEKYEYKGNIYSINVSEYELGFETSCSNITTNERMPVRWVIHYKEYREACHGKQITDPFRSIINGSKKTIRWLLGDEKMPI